MKKRNSNKIKGDRDLWRIFNSSILFSLDDKEEARTISSGLFSDNLEIRKATLGFLEEQFSAFHTDKGCKAPESEIAVEICSNILNALIKDENKCIEYELVSALEDWSSEVSSGLSIEILFNKLHELFPASLEVALRIVYKSEHKNSISIISEFRSHSSKIIQEVVKELTIKTNTSSIVSN